MPGGSGYILGGTGVVTNYTVPTVADTNCTSFTTQVLYATIDVGVMGVASPNPKIFKKIEINPCVYGDGTIISTVPLYTVIIGMDKGAVSYISWDDGCIFCATNGAECIDNTIDTNTSVPMEGSPEHRNCVQNADYCYPASTAANSSDYNYGNATSTIAQSPCDLKVFIVWTGTDSSGRYLTSAGKRFSRFRQYAAASAYQTGINVVADTISVANSALNIANSIPGRVAPGFRETQAVADDSSSALPSHASDGFVALQPFPHPVRGH